MTNSQIRDLTLALLKADSEEEAVGLLKNCGFWDDQKVWRLYGDSDGNYATIGNQQSRPEAALVEKVVNSVDARLMDECMKRGIDPTSPQAPPSIRHAVARFFENRELQGEIGGTVEGWPKSRQLEQSQYITIAATGSRQSPSLTFADCGEGQTPARMPDTFLSINRTNKLRIPFVQGKYNMGGTGVLKFGGQHRLQLIISRRNPKLVAGNHGGDETAGQWGVTIVRRERPQEQAGQVRNSVFRYLAPVGAVTKPQHGEILAFTSTRLPLMPDANEAYNREIEWGSVIKLYEYDMRGFKSHVLMPNGLLSRLELLLPEIALPVRVHECRDFRGHEGSFANTLVGLTARLDQNRGGNLEPDYPTSVPLTVHGEQMIARIYAFKEDKAESYRTNEGIIFTINGQTQGAIPKTFFSRTKVKMGRLASALLVVVDCTKLSVLSREDLFMNSRDRLSYGDLRKSIEEELEEVIGNHAGLRELRERRRNQEIAERLEDSRPLEQVLNSILKSSPSLAKLFLLGQRLSRPHRAGTDGQSGGGQGSEEGKGEFQGCPHPTYFRFFHKRDGETIDRNCEIARRCRIKFETDVENEYFGRANNRGHYQVEAVDGLLGIELDNSLTLHNGIANWSISLPEEGLSVGDTVTIQCTVFDDVLSDPFTNIARLHITSKNTNGGGGGSRQSSSSGGESGKGGSGPRGQGGTQGLDGTKEPGGIQMPRIIPVHEAEWQQYKFDQNSACKIIDDGTGDEDDERSSYTFYINMDNVCLRTDMKNATEDVALMEAKFKYGNVLIGLALIHDHRNRNGQNGQQNEETNGDGQAVEAKVETTTRAMAPFLVPMIDYLGSLSEDQVAGLAHAGDED
jgi:hypothetical protein